MQAERTFLPGEFYKRSKIHDSYGGNRQRGIANCPQSDLILIFTKSKKNQDVYMDEWRDDYFFYSGEGRVGDMEMTGGNKSIFHHEKNNRKIHLFKETTQSGYWEYVDQLKLVDIKKYENLDDNGDQRNAFQFVLISTTKEDEKERKHLGGRNKKYNYNEPKRTERKGLVTSRVGQGYYRQEILDRWDSSCAVTGSSLAQILIASHILPWSKSTDSERLDVGNGILLSPNLDALFDKHLISFDNDGKVLISNSLERSQISKLGITYDIKLKTVFPDMVKYLEKHRKFFYEGQK
jgi:5-methylcytosine-specific restriction protein A